MVSEFCLYVYGYGIMGKRILMRLFFHVVCMSRSKENMLDSVTLDLVFSIKRDNQ